MVFNFMRWTPSLAFERQKMAFKFHEMDPRGKIGQVKIQYFIDNCNRAMVANKSKFENLISQMHIDM